MGPQSVLKLYKRFPNWPLLAAQGWTESRFRPEAESPAGALGVSQFMPLTWSWAKEMGWIGKDAEATDPEAATQAQHRFMIHLYNQFGFDKWKALAAYNYGPGNVNATIRKHGNNWERHLPFETRSYIRQIIALEGWIRMFGTQ